MTRRIASIFGFGFVACVSFVYAASLLFARPGHMAAADSQYHFVVAREIWRGTLAPDVARGLPWTVLHDMPVDHYWGYHALVAPFGAFADPESGMKSAACTMFAVVFVAMFLFLRSRSVPFAWGWAMLPAMFSTQDWRYLQLRGGQLILPLLFASVHAAFFVENARLRRVLLVAFAYLAMLSYHGGALLFPVHVAGVLALAAAARVRGEPCDRARLIEPLFTAAGLALGLTLNPYMDARASTWRFAVFHIGHMGSDSAGLYDDLEVSEFHGFPAVVFRQHPEWAVLLAAVGLAIAFVARRAAKKERIAPDAIVIAAVTAVCILLTARAMRIREYAVPMGFCLLALLSRTEAPIPWFRRAVLTPVIAALVPFGLVYHWDSTSFFIERHLPTNQFQGARALLDANGERPILNIAEADYCMLKWQKADVVCVQGLSRYFLYANRPLYSDVWELHDRAETSPETMAILRRFYDRGVRLVTTHRTHALARWAEDHPGALVPLYRSAENGAMIWAIEPGAVGAVR